MSHLLCSNCSVKTSSSLDSISILKHHPGVNVQKAQEFMNEDDVYDLTDISETLDDFHRLFWGESDSKKLDRDSRYQAISILKELAQIKKEFFDRGAEPNAMKIVDALEDYVIDLLNAR